MNDVLKEVLTLLANGESEKPAAAPGPEKKEYSVNARQISNGWIVNESWVEEEEENGECCRHWKNLETYHATLPFNNA